MPTIRANLDYGAKLRGGISISMSNALSVFLCLCFCVCGCRCVGSEGIQEQRQCLDPVVVLKGGLGSPHNISYESQ